MATTDTRKLKPEVQEQLRKQVICLRKSGKPYKEIGEIVGIHPTNACKIYKAYEKGGTCATSLNMAHFLKINRVTLSQPRDDSQTNHPIPILKNIFAYLADSFHR